MMAKSQQDQYTSAGADSRLSLVKLVSNSRAFVLLLALLLQILLSGPDIGGRLFDMIVRVLTIMAAVFVSSERKSHLRTGMALGVPSLVLVLLSYWIDNLYVDWSTYFILVLLYLFIVRLMLIQIFYAKEITINTIGLALCTYILIGTVWVLFYTPVIVLDPNAFSVPITGDGEAFHTLIYFSYVTLTTLGYGDISPVSNIARNLAVLEAITGTLFLAVLISRLVGSYVSRQKK
jgi:voltage-gated potassium channel